MISSIISLSLRLCSQIKQTCALFDWSQDEKKFMGFSFYSLTEHAQGLVQMNVFIAMQYSKNKQVD